MCLVNISNVKNIFAIAIYILASLYDTPWLLVLKPEKLINYQLNFISYKLDWFLRNKFYVISKLSIV